MKTPLAILTDTTLCTGCEKCVQACREENNLDDDVPRRWKSRIDDLSSTRYTTIVRCRDEERRDERRDEEKPKTHFVRQQCRHCVDPACVSACLVGALQQPKDSKGQPIGPVIYDGEKCMGCRYCMMACPYGIPRYAWEEPVPYIRKCNMCFDRVYDRVNNRVKEGAQPACVEACPQKATIFGQRDELLRVAKDRIREDPDKKIFGETEVGGTSVIYVSDIPLDFLAFERDPGDSRLPELTWAALSKVPPLVMGVGAAMSGIWWIVGRRMKLATEAARSLQEGQGIHGEPSESPQPSEEYEA